NRNRVNTSTITDKDVERFANFKRLRADEIDRRQHILQLSGEVGDSMSRFRTRVIRIARGPSHHSLRAIEGSLRRSNSFALLVKDRRLLNSERSWLDCRFNAF